MWNLSTCLLHCHDKNRRLYASPLGCGHWIIAWHCDGHIHSLPSPWFIQPTLDIHQLEWWQSRFWTRKTEKGKPWDGWAIASYGTSLNQALRQFSMISSSMGSIFCFNKVHCHLITSFNYNYLLNHFNHFWRNLVYESIQINE